MMVRKAHFPPAQINRDESSKQYLHGIIDGAETALELSESCTCRPRRRFTYNIHLITGNRNQHPRKQPPFAL